MLNQIVLPVQVYFLKILMPLVHWLHSSIKNKDVGSKSTHGIAGQVDSNFGSSFVQNINDAQIVSRTAVTSIVHGGGRMIAWKALSVIVSGSPRR